MSITREEILQIANLARLRLTDSESEDLSHDLNQILEYVDTLASLQVPAEERLELGPPHAPTGRLFFADSKPDKGTAARGADKRCHGSPPT